MKLKLTEKGGGALYKKIKYIFSFLTIILALVLTILFKLDLLSCFVCVTNIFYFMFLSEKNLLNFGFGLASSVAYVFISLNVKLYGEVIYFLIVDIPLTIIAFVNWLRHRESKLIVKPEKMQTRTFILTILCSLIGVICLALISRLLHGENIWIDSIVSVLSFAATLLMLLRKNEQWFYWIILYIFGIILWLTTFNLLMVIMCAYSLLASIFGYIEWNKNLNKKTT